MSDWFLGEIRLFPMNWVPVGWHLCDGSILQVSQYQALFALLGKYYGGNGTTTFGLPDLRGRAPLVQAQLSNANYPPGSMGGTETVQLTIQNLPAHNHMVDGQNQAGTAPALKGNTLASAGTNLFAAPGNAMMQLNPGQIAAEGGSDAHANMQPFLVLNFCIATTGIFPPRN